MDICRAQKIYVHLLGYTNIRLPSPVAAVRNPVLLTLSRQLSFMHKNNIGTHEHKGKSMYECLQESFTYVDLPKIDFNRSPKNYENFIFHILHGIRLLEIENIKVHTARYRHTIGFQNYLSSSKEIDTVTFHR